MKGRSISYSMHFEGSNFKLLSDKRFNIQSFTSNYTKKTLFIAGSLTCKQTYQKPSIWSFYSTISVYRDSINRRIFQLQKT